MPTTRLDAAKKVMQVMGLNGNTVNYMTSEMKVCNVTRLWSIREDQYDKIIQKSAGKLTKINMNELREFTNGLVNLKKRMIKCL